MQVPRPICTWRLEPGRASLRARELCTHTGPLTQNDPVLGLACTYCGRLEILNFLDKVHFMFTLLGSLQLVLG